MIIKSDLKNSSYSNINLLHEGVDENYLESTVYINPVSQFQLAYLLQISAQYKTSRNVWKQKLHLWNYEPKKKFVDCIEIVIYLYLDS